MDVYTFQVTFHQADKYLANVGLDTFRCTHMATSNQEYGCQINRSRSIKPDALPCNRTKKSKLPTLTSNQDSGKQTNRLRSIKTDALQSYQEIESAQHLGKMNINVISADGIIWTDNPKKIGIGVFLSCGQILSTLLVRRTSGHT